MKLLASLLVSASLFATLVASTSFAADTPAAKPAEAKKEAKKPDLTAGEAKYNAAACASCHNADGNSGVATNPKLAGQHYGYLYEQLQEFKSGKRANAVMMGMVQTLTDEDMQNISAFLASKKMKPGFAKNKDLVAAGEKIYKGGIADKAVPACAGCHGPTGAGMPKEYARLGGQHAEYTTAQLIAMRDGGRKNSATMTAVTAKLSDKEIKALADYIAGLR